MPFYYQMFSIKGRFWKWFGLFFKNQEKTFFKVKFFKNSRKKLKNSREKPKTQGKNSTSRIFDTRPRSKLMLKKMPDVKD